MTGCKKGDHVITLGPESGAPGSRIVCEAKENKAYDTSRALSEMDTARKNRNAQVDFFVFSRATAPEGMAPFQRYGSDIILVWDKDDPSTDIILEAGLSVARAIVFRDRAEKDRLDADLQEIERAISGMAQDASQLGDVTKWAGSIKKNSQRILDRVEQLRADLERQVWSLTRHTRRLKSTGDPDPGRETSGAGTA